MITLYNFGPYYELPDPSPFCLRVDCYLRATGLDFTVESGMQNMKTAPKGKLPYIDDGDTRVPDSRFILDYLKKTYGDPLDEGLSDEQRALTHFVSKTLDEDLYWCIVYSRWIDDAVWPSTKAMFFDPLPFPMRTILPKVLRKGVRKQLHAQGLGRHSPEEIVAIATTTLDALAALLGDRKYFITDQPTTLDVSAFAFLAEMIVPPHDCDLSRAAKSFPTLAEFVQRMRARYYA